MSHASELVMTDGHWIMLLLGESADGYPPSGDTGDTGYIHYITLLSLPTVYGLGGVF